jgi:hypothetical protein
MASVTTDPFQQSWSDRRKAATARITSASIITFLSFGTTREHTAGCALPERPKSLLDFSSATLQSQRDVGGDCAWARMLSHEYRFTSPSGMPRISTGVETASSLPREMCCGSPHGASEVANDRGAATKLTKISGRSIVPRAPGSLRARSGFSQPAIGQRHR